MLKNFDWAKFANSLAFVIIALGFLALYLGWNGAASVDCVACQIPYLISGGAIGVGLIVVGVGVLVVQNSRRRSAELEARMESLQETLERTGAVTSGPLPADATAEIPAPDGYVVAGASSYHLPDCHLVGDRGDVELITEDDAEDRGLNPCRVCKP